MYPKLRVRGPQFGVWRRVVYNRRNLSAAGGGLSVRICVLGSGSRGNSTLIATERTRLLIDAGFSRKETARRLAEAGETPTIFPDCARWRSGSRFRFTSPPRRAK